MNEANTTTPRDERQHYRSVFWAAYEVFCCKCTASTPAMLPDGTYEPGGPHDPAWERWSRWRADFQLCGEEILHGEQRFIFSRHMCRPEGDEKRLSVRQAIEQIQIDYGSGSIGMNLFYSTKQIIAEKVGAELERRGVWPVCDYMRYTPGEVA